ncbi:MAG: hypothetical protein Q9194_007076, partial [Teloschistes cf. exilis]
MAAVDSRVKAAEAYILEAAEESHDDITDGHLRSREIAYTDGEREPSIRGADVAPSLQDILQVLERHSLDIYARKHRSEIKVSDGPTVQREDKAPKAEFSTFDHEPCSYKKTPDGHSDLETSMRIASSNQESDIRSILCSVEAVSSRSTPPGQLGKLTSSEESQKEDLT